jgi:hypothetical protein
MKTESKTYTVELAPGMKAKYSLEHAGQQAPHEGDGVVVLAKIMLPARNSQLIPEIQFYNRVRVGPEPLNAIWGAPCGDDYRYMGKDFVAAKWSEAFMKAADWARTELQRLEDALKARAKALEDAES